MPETERRERRIAAGLCPTCGANEPAPGRVNCAACARQIAAANSLRRDQLAQRGTCVKCGGRRARQGRRTCKACGRYWTQANEGYRERRRGA